MILTRQRFGNPNSSVLCRWEWARLKRDDFFFLSIIVTYSSAWCPGKIATESKSVATKDAMMMTTCVWWQNMRSHRAKQEGKQIGITIDRSIRLIKNLISFNRMEKRDCIRLNHEKKKVWDLIEWWTAITKSTIRTWCYDSDTTICDRYCRSTCFYRLVVEIFLLVHMPRIVFLIWTHKTNARNIDCRRVALTFLIETTLCRRRHMLHIRLYVVRWRRLHSSKQKNFTNWSRWVISVFVKFYFHVRVCVCNNNDKYNIAEIRWNRFPILFFTFRTDICITRLVA